MHLIGAPVSAPRSHMGFRLLLLAGMAAVPGAVGSAGTSSPLRDSRLYVFRDQHGRLQMTAPGVAHGVRIGKRCDTPHCPGDLTECIIELGHADSFGDTIEIQAAWDVVDPKGDRDRVPVSGNLPILLAEGNTTCTAGGGLPCLVCAGGATCGGNPAVSNEPGVVVFVQNQYVIEPDDPAVLENQANVLVRDLCDASPSNCSMIPNLVQFTASTEVAQCDDANPCTVDTCEKGVCTNTPQCTLDSDCADEGNPCTTETCDLASGCCLRTPDCTSADDCEDDGNACTTEACSATSCCEHVPECVQASDCVDDGNPCTLEVCTPQGCCDHVPQCTGPDDCDDQDPCTSDECSPSGCCLNPPVCVEAADCPDDGNACTREFCAPNGCCNRSPQCVTSSDCPEDGSTCARAVCTDSGCCERVPGCVTDADCDDDRECTEDRCVDGCCESIEGPDCIPTMSQWGLAVMVLLLAIAAKLSFGPRPLGKRIA